METSGLTTQQAEDLLKKYGPNEIPEVKQSPFKKLLKRFISPVSLMLFLAAILSLISGKVFDFFFILFLLLLNVVVAFWQESKADNAIEKLNQHLSTKVKVKRDGQWLTVDSRDVVPGDIIKVATGSVIVADGEVLEVKNASVNESALTGESLPKQKQIKDKVFSGSFLSTGLMTIKITATGKNTYFGKTLFSVERSRKKSILEADIIRISQYLSALSLLAVLVLSAIFLYQKFPITDLLTLDLSLVIAGIPISLPTVMTLIIELGVLGLAKKSVIVRKLSALEDLANVNLLLTDKTGTLTKNLITVQKIALYGQFKDSDILRLTLPTSRETPEDPINRALIKKAQELNVVAQDLKLADFTPADSVRKRSTTLLEDDGKKIIVSFGAPQIIESLCNLDKATKDKFDSDVKKLAEGGYRSLAVAMAQGQDEKNMQMVGMLALSDTLREDAKEVIDFIKANNISVVMLTGDNRAIAKEIATKLDINGGKVMTKAELDKLGWSGITADTFKGVGAFAEILPDDKYQLVKVAKDFFVVAVNGDGINDLPAIKEANVGMAVKSAVDVLKGAADIVLLSDGIVVIKDAIIEGRKIFARLYTYSIYRISESLRLIITIAVLGFIYLQYPLTPLQLILLALLNDIPIISLAYDRVQLTMRPSRIKVKERFIRSSLFGLTGVANSLILFFLMVTFWHLPWPQIQTIFFLKLTVSGHMLIYVVRTRQLWFKFLPAPIVIVATVTTQIIASLLAFTGLFMSASIPLNWIVGVWLWALLWMHITEVIKLSMDRVFASWEKAQ